MLPELETVYKLFRIKQAPITWGSLLEGIDRADGFDLESKKKLQEAIAFLKMELGKSFFDTCGIDHPVKLKLMNVQGLPEDLLSFVHTLQKLKSSDSNYSFLLSKLKSRNICRNEGRYFTEIASSYLLNNFNVYFPMERQDQKNADIRITDRETKDIFFIEVSRVDDSEIRKRIQNEHTIISNTFINYGFDLFDSCKQLQHIPNNEMGHVVNAIKRAKDRAYLEKGFILFRNEYIDFAVAHPAQREAYERWCKENQRQSGVSGLSVDFDDTRRILQHSKIRNKVKQLPKDATGLIYMPINFLYFMSMDKARTVVSIAEEIEKYPHLLGIVLYADLGQPMPEKAAIFMEHAVVIKMVNGLARHTIFVYNHGYRGSLSVETVQKIKRCIY